MELLERIAELEHNQSHLKVMNTEMREWLDVADDEMVTLRSENNSLKKQVKALEKTISETSHDEAEPSGFLRGKDLDVDKFNEKKIQEMEEDAIMMKEENKKLHAELKSFKEEKIENQATIRNLWTNLQTTEGYMEEAHLELQQKNEIIHQKMLQLNYLEDTVEESSNIIEDLRGKNQDLKQQLEEGLVETSLYVAVNEPKEKVGLINSPPSIAYEIEQLIAAEEEVEPTSTNHSSDLQQEEIEVEEEPNPPMVIGQLHPQRSADTKEKPFWSCLMGMLFFFLTLFVLVASRMPFYINEDLRNILLMFHPHVSIRYTAPPPI